MSRKKKITVAISGGFDPIHIGHIRMIRAAKQLGDTLVVILNGDEWLQRKKGKCFMRASQRAEILNALRDVDYVHVFNSKTDNVIGALRNIKPDIFANGGDRKVEKDIPEADICKKMGIRMMFSVGGGKVSSSSELLKKWNNK